MPNVSPSLSYPHEPPPHPAFLKGLCPLALSVVNTANSSADVGCIPTNESKFDFVAPICTAREKPCTTSPAEEPRKCKPTTLLSADRSHMSLARELAFTNTAADSAS